MRLFSCLGQQLQNTISSEHGNETLHVAFQSDVIIPKQMNRILNLIIMSDSVCPFPVHLSLGFQLLEDVIKRPVIQLHETIAKPSQNHRKSQGDQKHLPFQILDLCPGAHERGHLYQSPARILRSRPAKKRPSLQLHTAFLLLLIGKQLADLWEFLPLKSHTKDLGSALVIEQIPKTVDALSRKHGGEPLARYEHRHSGIGIPVPNREGEQKGDHLVILLTFYCHSLRRSHLRAVKGVKGLEHILLTPVFILETDASRKFLIPLPGDIAVVPAEQIVLRSGIKKSIQNQHISGYLVSYLRREREILPGSFFNLPSAYLRIIQKQAGQIIKSHQLSVDVPDPPVNIHLRIPPHIILDLPSGIRIKKDQTHDRGNQRHQNV